MRLTIGGFHLSLIIFFMLIFGVACWFSGMFFSFSYHNGESAIFYPEGRKGEFMNTPVNERHYLIALMSFNENVIVEQMRKGFIDTIDDAGLCCDYKVYTANSDKNLLRSQIKEIVGKGFDVVLALGTTCSQLLKSELSNTDSKVPVIFGAIADPVGLGLIDSLESSKNNFTGVCVSDDILSTRKIESFLKLNDKVKVIGSIFTGSSEKIFAPEIDIISKVCSQKGVVYHTLSVDSVSEIKQKLPQFIQKNQIDTVLVFRDSLIMSAIETIVKYCNLHGIILFASEHGSVEKGAAIGYGQDEYYTGVACARKALPILVDDKHPSEIPVTSYYEPTFRINTSTMGKQGLVLDEDWLFLMKNTEFVT